MVSALQVEALCALHGSVLSPCHRLPDWVPRYLIMPLPDKSFHIVGEKNLGTGEIPRHDATYDRKVTDHHIVTLSLNHFLNPSGNLRLAVLGDGMWQRRKQVSDVQDSFCKAPG